MAPTVRIGDENWKRLQRWAIPLEDTVDDALGRLLDTVEAKGLKPDLVTKPQGGSLDQMLSQEIRALKTFSPAKVGRTMTRWEHKVSRRPIGITTNGANIVFLPRRGHWPSDSLGKVLHTANPKSGWTKGDRLRLRTSADVDYALRIINEDLNNTSESAA